eukprot:6031246-Pleurochrysis_carterae.AAC.1
MSAEAGDTSLSSESRSADAADAAECSAAAAATASLGASSVAVVGHKRGGANQRLHAEDRALQ